MSNLPRSSAPAGARKAPEDRESRAILAHPVLCKGRLRDDTVDQAVASVRSLGHRRRVSLKTDNEPALLDLR
eukprot:12937852-Alexandrium_andersonii.AAC.1